MKIKKYNDEESWLDGRLGKVTGTRLKDLIVKRGTKPKKGFYEIIAERVAIPASDENVMDRGHRLEIDAIERFSKETGKKVNTDLVIWEREDNPDIAISPDGYIGKTKITEAVEVKCLNSASHIEAYLTKEIPSEYEYQKLQYFIVNDDLKTLYFTFYDPRMPKDFFYFTVRRAELEDKIKEYLELERETLNAIKEIETELTF
jgi:hypothetical protein